MNELYTNATQDAQALNELATTLDKGQAYAAQICRKVAQLIEVGDGQHLDLRVDELQRLTISNPETAEVINGLAMMQRHERTPVKLCGNCRGVNQTVWWDVGTCPRCQRERVSLWGFPSDGPAPLENDVDWLAQEWAEHNARRGQHRHQDQQYFNAWRFAPVRSGQ